MSSLIHLGSTGGKPISLPLDIATESVSILARRGAGKTHCARVLAEGLLDHHCPVVIVDPVDVWWGIRVAKDGKGEGCNAVIFGGSHADLPLSEHAGKTLADMVVDRGISAVLVTDHLSIAASRRFLADFGERLYERKSEQKHRTPITLIIDESDRFAPQQVTPDAARCTGVIDELARRGRSRGVGVYAISQRPAVLNKNILTQTEVLICLQVTSPQDRKALGLWIEANADEGQEKLFMDTLASFQRGEAWVWSPSKLRIFERVQIRDVRTYDSSYTPKVGESRPAAPRLRPVDLDTLRAQLAETIQAAESNDPAKLKQEIARLKKELAAKPVAQAVDPAPLIAAALRARDRLWVEHMQEYRANIVGAVGGVAIVTPKEIPAKDGVVVPPAPVPACMSPRQRPAVVPMRGKDPVIAGRPGTLGKAERSVLTALAQYPSGRTKVQVAILTGYAHSGGGFCNALSSLRTKGYIVDEDGLLLITQDGTVAVGEVQPLPTGPDLLRHWLGQLGKAERLILEHLADVYPQAPTKEMLASAVGYEPNGGGFNNALSRLRTLELIEGRGQIAASANLMNT